MADITLLPSAKVPLIYSDTNTMSTEWYRFFWNVYGFTAAGVVPVSKGGTGLTTIEDHQIIIGNANNVFEPALLSSASIAITYPAGFVNLELGTSGVTPGTYGSASQVGVFTVNQYGVLTAASNTLIGIDASQIISGTIASARISGSYTGITGVGTLTVGTWNATTIGVAYGGTGQTTYTDGQLLIGNTTGNTLTKATLTAGTAIGITNGAGAITITNTLPDQTVVLSNGTGISVTGTYPSFTITNTTPSSGGTVTSVAATVPAFLSISGSPITTSGTLAITLSGTALPVANGGTGLTSLTANYIPYGNGTSGFSSSSTLTYNGTILTATQVQSATIGSATSSALSLQANATTYATLAASGEFLVGCTALPFSGTPTLGFAAKTNASGGIQIRQVASNSDWGINSASGSICNFYSSTAYAGSISVNGNITTYGSISDYRLKENIAPMSGALALIMKQRPVTYIFKATGQKSKGFIAHWLQEDDASDCVVGVKDAVKIDGTPDYQSVDPSFLVPVLTAALQELNNKFDAYVASHP